MFTVSISLSAVNAAPTVYVNTTGLDSNPGTIDAPYLTINKGAQSVDENGNIQIAHGVYSGENNTNITINKNMTIVGESQTETIINGSDINWIFTVNSGVVLKLQNLTLTNCNSSYGGAIFNNGTLNADQCIFTNNTAYWGGAIASVILFDPVNITTTVTNCTFIGNQAESGGAIASVSLMNGLVNCTVTGCNFSNNNATSSGGAIFAGNVFGISGSLFTLINSSFTLNHAGNGGAANIMGNCTVTGCNFTNNTGINGCAFSYFMEDPFDDYFCNIFDSNFTNNTFTEVPSNPVYLSCGGAVYNVHGKINLYNCNFTNNSLTGTSTYGGAICNAEGTLTANGCNFNNNNANYGGAICNLGGGTWYPATSTITHCSFTNNTALFGGALANYLFVPIFGQGSGVITSTVSFCNFTNNSATEQGGAIYNNADFSTTGSANINVNNSNFNSNKATYGGGIMSSCYVSAGSVSCIVNSSNFDSNTANGGGALYNYSNSGRAVSNILSSNFLRNNAVFGGAMVNNVFNGTTNVNFCRIFNNTGLGAAINNYLGIINANNNWWGINNPDFPNLLVGMINPANWLYMTINATPSTINTTQTSLIIVSFNNYSSDGSSSSPLDPNLGHIPDGTPVTFSLIEGLFGAYGILTPPLDIETTDGLASIVFTATRAGIQQINATTDNQTVIATVTINPASFVEIEKEFRNLPWGEVITTAYYNDKIYAIVKVHNQGPDGTSVSILDLLNGLTWTGNYYVVHAVGSYPITNDSWILNDPSCPFNGTHWNISSIPTMIGSVKWLAIECTINQLGTVSNYAETVNQSSYAYQGYDHYTTYLTANKRPSNIIIDNASGNKDEKVLLKAVLTDYLGNPLVSETVEFWIDGVKVGENTTDSTGTALFNYLITQTPGNHTLKSIFNETALYQGSNATGILYIPTADLYIIITSNKNNPTVGETFTLTYKLGNKGPDDAENVTITIPLPEGFHISEIKGDGNWNIVGNNIIWTFNNVTVGDPYLYISGWTTGPGIYLFSASIASDTFSINSRGVSSLSLNSVPQANAATTNTVGMQNTGIPLAGIVLAILMVLGGFISTRKKQ